MKLFKSASIDMLIIHSRHLIPRLRRQLNGYTYDFNTRIAAYDQPLSLYGSQWITAWADIRRWGAKNPIQMESIIWQVGNHTLQIAGRLHSKRSMLLQRW